VSIPLYVSCVRGQNRDFRGKTGIVTNGEEGSAAPGGRAIGRAPRPDPDVISRRIDAGTVLINLRTNKIYELNTTGSRIWELLKEGRTVGEIEATLQQEYEVEAAEAADAIRETLGRLAGEGLVRQDD